MSGIESEKQLGIEKPDPEIEAKVAKLLAQKPLYESAEMALAALNRELEDLAAKYSLSVPELVVKADASVEHNDDFLRALHIKSTITGLKRSLRK